MGKRKTQYRCQECGAVTARWEGRCPGCDAWNSIVEERVAEQPKRGGSRSLSAAAGGGAGSGGRGRGSDGGHGSAPGNFSMGGRVRSITDIDARRLPRLETGIREFDRLLGGGIVPGSVVLVGGEPGIGKSTLLLQVCHRLAAGGGGGRVLYVTGEESPEQVRLRADRLGSLDPNLLVMPETDVESIEGALSEDGVRFAVVDSVQTLYDPELESAPGSVAQLRECVARLFYRAKSLGLPLFLIGHVTKAGSVAGPRLLEHIVDAVLYFEGERHHSYRILRAVKNRFGSTDELAIFAMTGDGLEEVSNPSEVLLRERPGLAPGSVVAATIEGTRPLLVEVQALASPSGGFGAPRRVSNGLDPRRLALLLAVLEKRVGMRLVDQDVFVSLAGGLRVDEPAVDLAVVCAVASSLRGLAVPEDLVVVGEVGLSGEIRSVSQMERRLAEAKRLGFGQALVAERARLDGAKSLGMRLLRAGSVVKALDLLGM